MMDILGTAWFIGAISFLVGFIGPILFSTSNLGPLLGIFITGPLGFLMGGVIGFWRLLADSGRNLKRSDWGTFFAIWLLMLGWYGLFCWFGFFAIWCIAILQVVCAAGTAFLYWRRNRENWPVKQQRFYVWLAAALLLIGTELFPPVTHPWWAKPHDGYLPELPLVAYIGDERMNASRKVPQLAIDRPQLLIFWAGIMTAAVIGSYGRSNE